MSLPNPVFAGRYGCPACPDRFHSLGEKKRHIRAEHSPDQED